MADPMKIRANVVGDSTEVALLGDAKLTLAALIEAVKDRLGGRLLNRSPAEEIAAKRDAWLAHWQAKLSSAETPVTPYRVINYHTCNSCWNDPHHRFDHKDFLWCPRHKGTPRQFECTRLITVDQVKAAIQKIPGFAAGKA